MVQLHRFPALIEQPKGYPDPSLIRSLERRWQEHVATNYHTTSLRDLLICVMHLMELIIRALI